MEREQAITEACKHIEDAIYNLRRHDVPEAAINIALRSILDLRTGVEPDNVVYSEH